MKGDKGDTGLAGTARAYAEVDFSGPAFVASRTKGFTSVTRPNTGVYCMTATGIDARTIASVAAVDCGASAVPGVAEVRGSGLGCAATQFEVETFNLSGTLVNTISFHLIVP